MTDYEFLDHLPWYWGLAWAALAAHGRDDLKEVGRTFFCNSPRMFALDDLARRYPVEYAGLVDTRTAQAEERYSAKPWDEKCGSVELPGVMADARAIIAVQDNLLDEALDLLKDWNSGSEDSADLDERTEAFLELAHQTRPKR